MIETLIKIIDIENVILPEASRIEGINLIRKIIENENSKTLDPAADWELERIIYF
jgi:hypothetical protein